MANVETVSRGQLERRSETVEPSPGERALVLEPGNGDAHVQARAMSIQSAGRAALGERAELTERARDFARGARAE